MIGRSERRLREEVVAATAAFVLVATLTLGPSLSACSGSADRPPGPAVELCSEVGRLDRLTLTVLDRQGALVTDREVPEGGGPPVLPGWVRIETAGHEGTLRILATGWRGERPVGFGRASLELPGSVRLCLEGPYPSDRDGDWIPDDEDGCPDIPDPGQPDDNGDGVTNVCARWPDASVLVDGGPDAPVGPDGGPDAVPPPDAGPCSAGDPCNDGDPCTTGDLCGLQGECRGFAAGDGTQCGAVPAMRCCGGKCVNIAGDPKHCGGCDLRCATGRACQTVSVNVECATRPKQTSGRCICGYGDDTQCPKGQVCRTDLPVKNRCSPKSKDHCAAGQKVRWVDACPNYCWY